MNHGFSILTDAFASLASVQIRPCEITCAKWNAYTNSHTGPRLFHFAFTWDALKQPYGRLSCRQTESALSHLTNIDQFSII